MSKEHPILFSSDMVRAIQDGRKTQTRRIMKIQPPTPEYVLSTMIDTTSREDRKHRGKHQWVLKENEYTIKESDNRYFICPYGVVGDRLWVRETFGIFDVDADEDICICYKADNSDGEWFKDKRKDFNDLRLGKWRSPIHLHKWAARLWLEITGIRVERVQDISESDAKAEGAEPHYIQKNIFVGYFPSFQPLWDSINAKRDYGWEVNPWIWRLEFKRIEK